MAEEDKVLMTDFKPGDTASPRDNDASTEKSVFMKEGGVVSTDDLIEELFANRTWKYTILVFSLVLTCLAGPSSVYVVSFAGINPTAANNWTCKSQECKDLVAANSSLLQEFPCRLTKQVDGNTELLLRYSDIEYNMSRSSFAVEFDLNCNVGGAKELKTLLSSIYFAGAFSGLIAGSFLFDQIGRKRTSMIGYILAVLSAFAGTFCHNYYFMLTIRFLQGFGCRIVITGMFILCMELIPRKYRNYTNFVFQILWSAGYPIAVVIGYFATNWNYMFLATSIVLLIANLPILFCIESPRYFLIKNDEKSARRSIQALASLTHANIDTESVELEDLSKAQERRQSFWRQLLDLCSYPSLLLETLIQMFLWFVIAMSYYGFNFGWGSIVPDRYIGFLLSAVGQLIALTTLVPLVEKIGRRRAMILLFLGAGVFYLIGIADVKLGKNTDWTLESVCCLIGAVFVSAQFAGVYLWTAELAPTSHRGFVFSMSSSAARVGSFLGPYIFNNLKPVTHRAVPLGVLAVLALLCALGSFVLVETGNRETALTGEDVAARRSKKQ